MGPAMLACISPFIPYHLHFFLSFDHLFPSFLPSPITSSPPSFPLLLSYSVYAYFAPEIGKLFFPKGSPNAQAVKTFTVFAGGFLMRPLGSVILGAVGDKYGTKAALKWSILLMTVPTVATGCLPTYARVGIAAPLMLTACRLLQGLSVGGELVGALLHTADHSPPEKRGFFCGVVGVFGSLGNLLGAVVSVSLRRSMSRENLLAWGWRIPFLTGSVLGLVGIYLRTKTDALRSPEERKEKKRLKMELKAANKVHEAAEKSGAASAPVPVSLPSTSPPSTIIATAVFVEEGRVASASPSPVPSSPCSSGAASDTFDIDFVEAAIALEQARASGCDENEDEDEDEEEEEESDEEDREERKDENLPSSGFGNSATSTEPPLQVISSLSTPPSLPLSSSPDSHEHNISASTQKCSSTSSATTTKKFLKKLKRKKKPKKTGKCKRKSFLQILRDGAATDKVRFLHVAGMAALQSSLYYLHLVWVGTYMAQLARFPIGAAASFSALATMQILLILTGPLWGAAGDRFGGAKKRVVWLIAGVAAGMIILPSAFSLLSQGGETRAFTYAVIGGLTMGFCLSGNYTAWVTETLKDSPARVMATSVAYNLGAMVGGCAPMLYSVLSRDRFPQVAPVLPPLVYGAVILCVFSFARFDPRGIFHPSKWVEEEKREGAREEEKKEVEMEMRSKGVMQQYEAV